jgi:hypothetical protein
LEAEENQMMWTKLASSGCEDCDDQHQCPVVKKDTYVANDGVRYYVIQTRMSGGIIMAFGIAPDLEKLAYRPKSIDEAKAHLELIAAG